MIQFWMLLIGCIAYLLAIEGWGFFSLETVWTIRFFSNICRIALSLCGVILTINNMETKINNRANFMALSSLGIGVFIILHLKDDLGLFSIGEYGINSIKCKWVIDYLQILSLWICMRYINEQTKIMKCWLGMLGVVGLGIGFIYSETSWLVKSFYLNEGRSVSNIIYATAILLAILCFIDNYKRIQDLEKVEKTLINRLFVLKVGMLILMLVRVNNNSPMIHIVEYVAQLSFTILVLVYINEVTLAVTWRKIDVRVDSKNKQVTRGAVEQKTLVVGAKKIQKEIQEINRKTLHFEMKLVDRKSDKKIAYIQKVKNNCYRLLKLSDNILDLNTYEAGNSIPQFQYINLTELIGGVIESLEPYIAQRGIKIDYMTSKECIMATVDEEAIERLLLNLISNAIKYNKENGSIQVLLTERKKQIYLCVKDTGIGIPLASLNAIFEKFKRVDSGLARIQEGSGLGLSIVKSLVELHHGEIKIISKEEKGTLISIGLPIIQENWEALYVQEQGGNDLKEKIQVEFSDLERG